jgi:hypothetical protein
MILTTAQLTTLKNAINAETDPTFVGYRNANNDDGMASFYNVLASPSFTVWKSFVTITDTGKQFVGTEWAGMTSANHTRLQTVSQWLNAGYSPALADIRAMFDDIWSGAGGTQTRAKYLAFWKRFATRGEKLYATGTGSDAVPATLVCEGDITSQNISDARRLP